MLFPALIVGSRRFEGPEGGFDDPQERADAERSPAKAVFALPAPPKGLPLNLFIL
jgi:hypothetical protein